jgi:hypothetical protein
LSAQHEFYRERAAEARAGAKAATLQNIRDRWLLSEASWRALATRSQRADKLHQKLVSKKATERAARAMLTQG